jgi:hypothetical protein
MEAAQREECLHALELVVAACLATISENDLRDLAKLTIKDFYDPDCGASYSFESGCSVNEPASQELRRRGLVV